MAEAAEAKTSRRPDDSVRSAYVLVDTRQLPGGSFENFRCQQFRLADLTVYDIAIDPIIIQRRPDDISKDGVDDFFLTTLLDGQAHIQQGDAEIELDPGVLAVVDGGQPYLTVYTRPSHRLVVQIPRRIFEERVWSRKRAFRALALPPGGLVNIVTDLFKSLAARARHLSITDQHTLANSFLELASALIRAAAKDDENNHRRDRPQLVQRILAYMETHYADADLSPDKIAGANGISTRYLHSLFQQMGTTTLKWVWERRLKSARQDLLDPALLKMRISDIAYRQGFNDSAHFSRAFRDRFGIAPSQLRKIVRTQQDVALNF